MALAYGFVKCTLAGPCRIKGSRHKKEIQYHLHAPLHVEVEGRRITRRPESERASIRASSIGILLQYGNLLEHLTVAENARVFHPGLSGFNWRRKAGRLIIDRLDAVFPGHGVGASDLVQDLLDTLEASPGVALAADGNFGEAAKTWNEVAAKDAGPLIPPTFIIVPVKPGGGEK